MIEKVKLNEVAKDLNISGKDLTALLQQRFGGEAKKPQTVLSGEELNFVMEHYTQQHAVKDFGEYFKLGEKKPAPAAAPKPAEKPAAPRKPIEIWTSVLRKSARRRRQCSGSCRGADHG